MIKILTRIFLKNTESLDIIEKRTKFSIFAGILGIVCNAVLFLLKLVVGMAMSSIAIISDACNNLSDAGSSVVSIVGAKLSGKKPDREHPFGHGRMEYVFSLIVAFIIMLVGFELFKTSAVKVFKPDLIEVKPAMMVILCASVLIKLWMYSYNKYIGKQINSGILLAASRDSVNDAIATGAVIVSSCLGKALSAPWIDGAVGAVVSIVIMYSGLSIALGTIGLLLGTPPEKETIESLKKYILEAPGVSGVHDLIVHDYGPGRRLASVHAEVPDDCDVVEIHEVIDDLEKKIESEMGIHIVIHMDPIAVNCEKTQKVREDVKSIVKSVDERMNIHDFRMTDGINTINLIFDVEVPPDFDDIEGTKTLICKKIHETDDRYNAVINIDFMYD